MTEYTHEMLQQLLMSQPTCKVVKFDKVSLCGLPGSEMIIVGEDKALMIVCAEHNIRLLGGEAFMVQELQGDRNFAIQLNSPSPDDTLDSPLLSEPPQE